MFASTCASIGGKNMAKRITLEFLSDGFRELLLSDEVSEVVMEAANRVAETATSEAQSKSKAKDAPRYVVKGPRKGGYGGGRIIAYVAPDNAAAYTDQARYTRLEQVIWEEQV